MAPQHDYTIDNNTGLLVRTDINNVLAAIVSNNSGLLEPTDTFPYMWWADTTLGLLKIRNAADSGWVTLGDLTVANLGALLKSGGTMTGAILLDNAATVATPDIAFDGDANTGMYASAADLLGLVAAGVELLRADGVLGYVKLLGTKALQLPSGTVANRPTGVAGLLRHNSDSNTFEGYTNGAWGSLGGFSGYAAVVGSETYCTHATLAAAIADAGVLAGSKILVVTSETVNTSAISLSKANMQIEFMPGISFTNGTAGTCFSIDAAGVRIKGARFVGFTTAVSIAATFNFNFVLECRFNTCTNEVVELDGTPNNVYTNNITE